VSRGLGDVYKRQKLLYLFTGLLIGFSISLFFVYFKKSTIEL
jgi:hypothetical protein